MAGTKKYEFRLYVAGDAENSLAATANLRRICDEHLPGQYRIERIDVLREPMRAMADGVLLTPTVVRVAPLPSRRVVGSLTQSDIVVHALGLAIGVT
jgi:circadian clock protein KaiB